MSWMVSQSPNRELGPSSRQLFFLEVTLPYACDERHIQLTESWVILHPAQILVTRSLEITIEGFPQTPRVASWAFGHPFGVAPPPFRSSLVKDLETMGFPPPLFERFRNFVG